MDFHSMDSKIILCPKMSGTICWHAFNCQLHTNPAISCESWLWRGSAFYWMICRICPVEMKAGMHSSFTRWGGFKTKNFYDQAPRPRDPKRHALPIEFRIFSAEGGLSERVHQKVCNILQRLTSTWIGYAQMIGHISLVHKVATLFAVSACRSTAVVYSTDTDI